MLPYFDCFSISYEIILKIFFRKSFFFNSKEITFAAAIVKP